MSGGRRRSAMAGATSSVPPQAPGGGPDLAGLAILGLQPGEGVRWQVGTHGRWHSGAATHRERDGSVGVIDGRGAARSFPVDRLQVRCLGPRGGIAWESLAIRAGRNEQLCLLDAATVEVNTLPVGSPHRRPATPARGVRRPTGS